MGVLEIFNHVEIYGMLVKSHVPDGDEPFLLQVGPNWNELSTNLRGTSFIISSLHYEDGVVKSSN